MEYFLLLQFCWTNFFVFCFPVFCLATLEYNLLCFFSLNSSYVYIESFWPHYLLFSSQHPGTPWFMHLFYVLDTFQCNITFFRRNIMVSNRSHFTISTNQILFILNSIWKSNIFKCEHVIHSPIVFQQFTLCHRLFILLMHHW